jgi:hypothetical protein
MFSSRSPQYRPMPYRIPSPITTPAMTTGSMTYHFSAVSSCPTMTPAMMTGNSSGRGSPHPASNSATKMPM